MIEDHSGRRLIPHFLPPMPRALAPPRALDLAMHSLDRGHGPIDPTRISVTDRRQHFDRLDRVLVLRRTAPIAASAHCTERAAPSARSCDLSLCLVFFRTARAAALTTGQAFSLHCGGPKSAWPASDLPDG